MFPYKTPGEQTSLGTFLTYGHVGMNKLVVNHLDKTIVTSDGATIVQELEVMHPAAKMVVLASQMQEQEAGDGTSLVVTLTGERRPDQGAGLGLPPLC